MRIRRRPSLTLLALVTSGFVIGAAAQLAETAVPEQSHTVSAMGKAELVRA
ncbi:hypothetical protein [Streptomyces jumonjinensis]|uniref:hypothetical protein n=1 Tax=Streptomyces jumonjinensis TaxID=1945 RepID=UPI0037918C23